MRIKIKKNKIEILKEIKNTQIIRLKKKNLDGIINQILVLTTIIFLNYKMW